ncbi:MAG: FeoB-associated Cys-rich membrane protein [Ruminococcus sp.]|nr:FeoB-associated Cys-rich membrane protein [Ruminococcus sp.]
MNAVDIILIIIIVLAVAFAVRRVIKGKSSCCEGCSKCGKGENCDCPKK